MKIYTRTGDEGKTGLFGGARVMKNDPRVEAYGTIDELNACLGVVVSSDLPIELRETILRLQKELFVLGAEVACEPSKLDRLKMKFLEQDSVEWMEESIDEHEKHLPPLSNFILPGGSKSGAALHLARTVARRAERLSLSLPDLRPFVFVYINRLSDFLFVLARRANHLDAAEETPWITRSGEN